MLASVAIEWLWLMAMAALVIHCSAMARWVPVRNMYVTYPFVWVLCLAVLVPVGPAMGLTLESALVLFAFSLVGLTIGLFPTRRLLTQWAGEINAGETRESYDWPRSHLAFCAVTVVVMLVAAFALTR